MVDKLSSEQREVGQQNYYSAVGSYYDVNRRDFLRGIVAAGAVSGAGLGALYFGYGRVNDPVRIAVIGTGDEGNVLIGGCNPDYVDVKAICDIRPFGVHRAFHGDWSSPSALGRRPGLISVAGYKDEAEARRNVKVYDASNGGIMACLDDPDIEAVIIALAALVACAGCCPGDESWFARVDRKADGAQRRPVQSDVADGGRVEGQRRQSASFGNRTPTPLQRQVRQRGQPDPLGIARSTSSHSGPMAPRQSARWRQLENADSRWRKDASGKIYDKIAGDIRNRQRPAQESRPTPTTSFGCSKSWRCFKPGTRTRKSIPKNFGYQDFTVGDKVFTAMDELHRWRLFDRTGAGLMAELGSPPTGRGQHLPQLAARRRQESPSAQRACRRRPTHHAAGPRRRGSRLLHV